MKKMNARIIAINAVLIATYIVLSMLAINLGPLKLTFESFPVILVAVVFGPVDAVIVGGLGELINQMLTFGLTPTTFLWILPIVSRALLIGILAKVWKKENSVTAIISKKVPVVFLGVSVIAGVLHSVLNTIALYVDSKMFGYYSEALVFGALFVRIATSVITAVIMGYATKSVAHVLKKASLI